MKTGKELLRTKLRNLRRFIMVEPSLNLEEKLEIMDFIRRINEIVDLESSKI